jgi:RNA-directed DNA polymerase
MLTRLPVSDHNNAQPYSYFNLQAVDNAYRQCRKRKRKTVSACLYETKLLDYTINSKNALQNLCWQPTPPIAFVVTKPKAREVYAAQFEDRVIHHLLINELEILLDSQFIFDAASNRKNKGTHFAVNRLQKFMQQHQGKGWFLQLDIANFFHSISQSVLLALLQKHLTKQVNKNAISFEKSQHLFWLCRQIILQKIDAKTCVKLGNPQDFNKVPKHKRLTELVPGKGIPIGNLTSQFFANIYLNELDQYIKHQLKCRHYVRYADDFILCHTHKTQLQLWQNDIAGFVEQKLALSLKNDIILQPISQGADFLGYIIKPYYKLVRKRVLGNLHEKLVALYAQLTPHRKTQLDCKPEVIQQLRAVLNSYWGHFSHADAHTLKRALFRRYAWLQWLFINPQQLIPRWYPLKVNRFYCQWRYFYQQYQGFVVLLQCGNKIVTQCVLPVSGFGLYSNNKGGRVTVNNEVITLYEFPLRHVLDVRKYLTLNNQAYVFCNEQGYLKGGLKKRCVRIISLAVSNSLVSNNLATKQTANLLINT